MHVKRLPPTLGAAVRLAFVGLAAAITVAFAATGCLDRPLCDKDCRPKTTNVLVDRIEQRSVDKIDLLLMIDNSISMADKQEILQKAVPDLVGRLVNPRCINPDNPSDQQTASSPQADCPGRGQYVREFQPIRDIHIGIVSSSLGAYAADDTCNTRDEENDMGEMIGSRSRAADLGLAQTGGFLDWDLNVDPNQSVDQFNSTFTQLVGKVGELGCGFEASLEAWYRFLIDPAPPQAIVKVACPNDPNNPCAQPQGRDEALIAQRAAFLRPDSLVAVIMLTDENDCSLQSSGQYYYPARTEIVIPRASSTCATNPNDRCCYSCGTSAAPSGCPPRDSDAACQLPKFTPEEDPLNLRCFEQRRRFGINFLYPIQRYVNALNSFKICPSSADLDPSKCQNPVDNVLYVNPDGSSTRTQDLVFLAGIVGVPWQDIQATTDADGNPLAANVLRFQTAAELEANGTWGEILGDPTASPPVAPGDVHMWESIDPRQGLPQPTAAPRADEKNGHEWAISDRNDLQYACIFPLQQPKDCENLSDPLKGCDCKATGAGNGATPAEEMSPLCQAPNGQAGMFGTTQYAAKAYPGLRHLQVLRAYGNNAIVASICPREVSDDSRPDFGYRPAVDTIVDRLKEALSGRCLSRQLAVTDEGEVPCKVVEAKPGPNLGCNEPRRQPAGEKLVAPAFDRLRTLNLCGGMTGRSCDLSGWTLCEILESDLDGDDADQVPDCLQNKGTYPQSGWCYVDPEQDLGEASLVERCDPTERRLLHFVQGQADTVRVPQAGATVLIACLGADIPDEGS